MAQQTFAELVELARECVAGDLLLSEEESLLASHILALLQTTGGCSPAQAARLRALHRELKTREYG